MYLLIPGNLIIRTFSCVFTSHYVSINSIVAVLPIGLSLNLHPTMYLLILPTFTTLFKSIKYLHPTMYLLIRLLF